MHLGIVMECDHRAGVTEEVAFDDAFVLAEMADELGLDGLWLAERHFAAPRNPTDPMGSGLPSIASVPLVLAGAMASRTKRIRIATGVSVLPLIHPIRVAEEAATVDHISKGRLDFGIGRSGFQRVYNGYDVPYSESRERFQEALDVILKAWNNERFSHEGKYYNFDNVCVVPKPYQKPHPPIRIAATTGDTFPMVGSMGFSVVTGVRGFDIPEVAHHLDEYRKAFKDGGHPGEPDVYLRIPVFVSESDEEGKAIPEESTMSAYRGLANSFAGSATGSGAVSTEDRASRGERLGSVTYEELLVDRLAYGNPQTVTERLVHLRDELGLSGIIIEPNVGGGVGFENTLNSVRLFATEVASNLRA